MMRKAILLQHKHKRYKKRNLKSIQMIVLHHSATSNGTAEAFARYHVDNLGWPGIGYHIVKDKHGLRLCNELDTISYHCSGKNTISVGICVQGNFDKSEPSDSDYKAWAEAVNYVYNKLKRKVPIHLHRDFSSKSCPGKLFDINKLIALL